MWYRDRLEALSLQGAHQLDPYQALAQNDLEIEIDFLKAFKKTLHSKQQLKTQYEEIISKLSIDEEDEKLEDEKLEDEKLEDEKLEDEKHEDEKQEDETAPMMKPKSEKIRNEKEKARIKYEAMLAKVNNQIATLKETIKSKQQEINEIKNSEVKSHFLSSEDPNVSLF
jgi:hypothetical protein